MFDGVVNTAKLSRGTLQAIEKTIKSHAAKAGKRGAFKVDPLLGSHSLRHSLESSAVKRHGFIIELAICDALRASGDYRVWHQEKFSISRLADQLVDTIADVRDCMSNRIPYGTQPFRTMKLDIISYRLSTGFLGAYEVKRGLYKHDADKIKTIRRNVVGVNASLADWAKQKHPGMTVSDAAARALFYYGARSIEEMLSVSNGFDMHFGCPVMEFVDAATAYMHALLFDDADAFISFETQRKQLVLSLGGTNA